MALIRLGSSIAYVGDGQTTIFTFPYYLIDPAHLRVTLLTDLGTISTKLLNVDFTFTAPPGSVYPDGGALHFSAAPPSGAIVLVSRRTPVVQPYAFNDGEAFPGKSFELALDRLALIAQEGPGGLGFQGYATAAPPDGTYNVGDWCIVWPPAPGVARFLVCAVAGTPGTWYGAAALSLIPEPPSTGGGTVASGGTAFLRQGRTPVPEGDDFLDVVFFPAAPDGNYNIGVTPNWNTTIFVDRVSANGFTAHFGTPAPIGDGLVYWTAMEASL